MSEISEKWDLIKETVRNEYDISNVSFDTWIVPLKFYEEKDTCDFADLTNEGKEHILSMFAKVKNYYVNGAQYSVSDIDEMIEQARLNSRQR